MFDDRKSRRVGAIVLALVAVALVAVVAIDREKLHRAVTVRIDFVHAGSLQEGADVQVAGRVIGTVVALELVSTVRASAPGHLLHGTGGVAAVVRIRTRYASWVGANSQFFVNSKGAFGEAYLEVGPPLEGERIPIREGDELRGIDPARIDLVLTAGFRNMTAFRRLLDDLAPSASALGKAADELAATLRAIEPSPGAYGKLGTSIAATVAAWDELRASWAATGVSPAALGDLIGRTQATLARLRGSLAEVGGELDRFTAQLERVKDRIPDDVRARLELAIDRVHAAAASLGRIAGTAGELASQLRDGRGTVGALLADPEFMDDAKQLGKLVKRQPWLLFGHPASDGAAANGD